MENTKEDRESLKKLLECYKYDLLRIIQENSELLKLVRDNQNRLPLPETEDQHYWYRIGQWDQLGNLVDDLACRIAHLGED